MKESCSAASDLGARPGASWTPRDPRGQRRISGALLVNEVMSVFTRIVGLVAWAVLSPADRGIFGFETQVGWETFFGGDNHDRALSVDRAHSGSIIAGSIVRIDHPLGADAYLARLDEFGRVMWERSYGGERYDEALSVRQVASNQGGFVVSGASGGSAPFGLDGSGTTGSQAYLLRVDEVGEVMWEKRFGAESHKLWLVSSDESQIH